MRHWAFTKPSAIAPSFPHPTVPKSLQSLEMVMVKYRSNATKVQALRREEVDPCKKKGR